MKKEYKKEDFQNLLSKDKILTREEARQHALEKGVIRTVSNCENKVYFYTNKHGFGWPILPNNFVSCSSYLPQEVTPREGLETGIVSIEEKYAFVYKQGYKLIESVDELVDYLNNTSEVNEMNNRKPKQERKLFPAYFPQGTEVEVCLFEKTVRFVVDHIVCNGYQSYVLVAKEDEPGFEGHKIFYNTSHVKRIIKRGTGPVTYENNRKTDSNDFYKYCNFAVAGKGPGKYSVYAIRDLIYHVILTTIDSATYQDMWLNWDALCAAFSRQSFIKYKEGDSFSPRYVDKKRAKRWIKQNLNRFLLSKKENQKREEDDEAKYYASEGKWDERNNPVHYPTEVVSQEESHYDSNDGPDYIDWNNQEPLSGGKTIDNSMRDLGRSHGDHETASISAYNPENLNKVLADINTPSTFTALPGEASDANVPVVTVENIPKGMSLGQILKEYKGLGVTVPEEKKDQ